MTPSQQIAAITDQMQGWSSQPPAGRAGAVRAESPPLAGIGLLFACGWIAVIAGLAVGTSDGRPDSGQ